MAVFQFPNIPVDANGKMPFGYVRITVETWALGTSLPTFGTPTSATRSPFEDIPSVVFNTEPEAGAVGVGDITLEVENRVFHSTTRFSSLLEGFHPFDSALWFKIEWSLNASAWTELFRGITLHPDVEYIKPDTSNLDTWKYSIKVMSYIEHFETKTVNDFISTKLLLATYNVGPFTTRICYENAGSPEVATLDEFTRLDNDGDPDWRTASQLRWFKIEDILQAASEFLDVPATVSVDNDWDFIIFDGSVEQAKSFGDLHIVSEVLDSGIHEQQNTFFDVGKANEISFYNAGSVLEMLKQIMLPFGNVIAFELSAGALKLFANQVASGVGITPSADAWQIPIEGGAAERFIEGMKVKTPNAGEYVQGSSGDGATAMKCIYMSSNRTPNDYDWINKGFGTTQDTQAIYQSLWALHSGTMYSVFKVTPKTQGSGSASYTANFNDPDAGLVIAKGMNHYWMNFDDKVGTNPVGVYRPVMRRVKVPLKGITNGRQGDHLNYVSKAWFLRQIEMDLRNAKSFLTAETGEW